LPQDSEVPELDFKCDSIQKAKWNALTFYREYVSQNKPVVFRGATNHWPAVKRWKNNDYFRSKFSGNVSKVTVSVTPNGYADAAIPWAEKGQKEYENGDLNFKFVMPHEEEMTAKEFLDILEATADTGKCWMKYGQWSSRGT